MLIDWFTVGAQALNFIILVGLMKRFLYKPILAAIDAREKRIATELANADAKRDEAQQERAEFEQKNEAFDAERATLLRKATDEAKAEQERLQEAARSAAEKLSTKRAQTLQSDAENLSASIARLMRDEVFSVARKALADLATTSLEDRMSEVFTRRLSALDVETKASLDAALKTSAEPALVRSAFALSEPQRAAIQNALNEAFSSEVRIRFETSPELISGIELATKGQKLAWTIDGYLASLEKSVAALVKGAGTPESKAALGHQGVAHEPSA